LILNTIFASAAIVNKITQQRVSISHNSNIDWDANYRSVILLGHSYTIIYGCSFWRSYKSI